MPSLVFTSADGQTVKHDLEAGFTTIGRHPDSILVLDNPSVSSHHAIVEFGARGCVLQDQQSSNGTRVNGNKVEEIVLRHGDKIAFGDVEGSFEDKSAAPAAAAPAAAAPSAPAAAPAVVAAPRQPPQASRRPAPPRAVRRTAGYPDESGNGCVTALVVLVLFVGAFATGLYLRHSKETGGNLFADLMAKLRGQLPQIEIKK